MAVPLSDVPLPPTPHPRRRSSDTVREVVVCLPVAVPLSDVPPPTLAAVHQIQSVKSSSAARWLFLSVTSPPPNPAAGHQIQSVKSSSATRWLFRSAAVPPAVCPVSFSTLLRRRLMCRSRSSQLDAYGSAGVHICLRTIVDASCGTDARVLNYVLGGGKT